VDGTVGYKPAESSGAKWLAIINPSAAGGSAAAEWPLIDRLLRRAGITAEAVFTAHRYHAVELTVAAVNDGIRHIIAVGGDTTLHEVVNGLFIQRAVRPEEITLGIIPTGNCRIAGIPKTYPEAVSAIASGYVSLYHIATVSYSQSHYRQERLMAGEAGMGLYAMLQPAPGRGQSDRTETPLGRTGKYPLLPRSASTYLCGRTIRLLRPCRGCYPRHLRRVSRRAF